jgi:GTPase SAR1 family protein
MKTGQGFLLVFSITSPSSLTELAELREQIIRIKDDENVPIVIVGNKSDLEEDRVVSRAKAFAVSQSWGNAPYYETSARRRGKCSIHSNLRKANSTKQTLTRYSWTSADRLFGGTTLEYRRFDMKLNTNERRDR